MYMFTTNVIRYFIVFSFFFKFCREILDIQILLNGE